MSIYKVHSLYVHVTTLVVYSVCIFSIQDRHADTSYTARAALMALTVLQSLHVSRNRAADQLQVVLAKRAARQRAGRRRRAVDLHSLYALPSRLAASAPANARRRARVRVRTRTRIRKRVRIRVCAYAHVRVHSYLCIHVVHT